MALNPFDIKTNNSHDFKKDIFSDRISSQSIRSASELYGNNTKYLFRSKYSIRYTSSFHSIRLSLWYKTKISRNIVFGKCQITKYIMPFHISRKCIGKFRKINIALYEQHILSVYLSNRHRRSRGWQPPPDAIDRAHIAENPTGWKAKTPWKPPRSRLRSELIQFQVFFARI